MRKSENWFKDYKTKEDWLKLYNDSKTECLRCWNDHGKIYYERDGRCDFGICWTNIVISRSEAELKKYLPYQIDNYGASGYHIQMIQADIEFKKTLEEEKPLREKADALYRKACGILQDQLKEDNIDLEINW